MILSPLKKAWRTRAASAAQVVLLCRKIVIMRPSALCVCAVAAATDDNKYYLFEIF